jgi:hypothetical protein
MEKALQALEHCDLCSDMPNCPGCAYLREPDCMEHLKRDIIALLKAQEPRVMTWQDVIGAAIECKPLYIEVKNSEDKEPGDDRWAMVTQYKDSITNGMIRAMSSYVTAKYCLPKIMANAGAAGHSARPTSRGRRHHGTETVLLV